MQTQSTKNFIFAIKNCLEEDTFLDLTFLTSTLKISYYLLASITTVQQIAMNQTAALQVIHLFPLVV